MQEINEENPEEKKGGLKKLFSLLFTLIVIGSLIVYFFIPLSTIEFGLTSSHSNFSLNNSNKIGMQFYENMRYTNKNISYKISNCSLKKSNDMEYAFKFLSNLTVLEFYKAESNEEISITCENKNKVEGGLFIAGEGGPVNISQTDNFNVITYGQILLLKDSRCKNPNVGIHELLHVLGFNHSNNKNNILYPVSKCSQKIGEDTIELINSLYKAPTYSDLNFENVSAIMHGRYLDINLTIKNNGLKPAEKSNLMIYADNDLIEKIEIDNLNVGYGRIISLSNVWTSKINIQEIELFINTSFNELDKKNNKVLLEIKK